MDVAPLRRRPRPLRMMWTREISQSPVRFCSIAISSTRTLSPPSTIVIVRSSKSPSTSISPARVSNRRILSRPVITTAPDSIEVTRVIGTKTRRRSGTSTTNPRIRGDWLLERRVATASRTFPTGSPFGSKTAVPARRARNTRLMLFPLMG
ncbi:unannotated protein [freshwater metagenome]|uniref:Unannotated protein n=1 Tax=freshwater metagenome TaxID=449393 RepID=A0A6J7B8N0_9ZZZZ